MAEENFTTKHTSVFVQFEPGKESYFLGDCVDLDSIPNPRVGDVALKTCWNRSRTGFDVLGVRISPPGAISFTLSHLHRKSVSALEQASCPFWLYVLESKCGDAGLIRNWERGAIIGGDVGCYITDDPLTNLANHATEDDTVHEFNITAPPPRIDVRNLTVGRKTNSLTRALNAIAARKAIQCGASCGTQIGVCDYAMAVESAAVGASGNVLYTTDGGTTWTATSAQPFGVNLNLLTCGYVPTPSGGVRMLAGRATSAGVPMQIAYSDDNGATWTTANIGSTNGEAFTRDKSLFIMDYQHIWACSTAGNVYFSSDGGATWTTQNATGASGGNQLNAIHFLDESFGIAVGAGDTVIRTVDGGLNWTALSATGKAVALQAVYVFSKSRWAIGTATVASGSCVMTYNGGTSYVTKRFTGDTSEQVSSMDFINDFVGLIVSNTAGPAGSLHYTKDGGHTWEKLTSPTNAGINSVALCDPNKAYAVGNVQGTTPLVVTASG